MSDAIRTDLVIGRLGVRVLSSARMLPLVDVPDRSVGRGCCAAPGTSSRGASASAAPAAIPGPPRSNRARLAGVYDLLEAAVDTLAVMSTADGWDLTVPEDDAELLAELRRHGVRPGQRLHVVTAEEAPEIAVERKPKDQRKSRRLSFAGSIQAEPDLSEKTDEYLKGFGQG